MAKLTFPQTVAPYRGFIGEVRGWFNRIASYKEKSPDAKVPLLAHIAVLLTQVSGGANASVANAQELTIPVTGTYASKATLTVTGGAVTAIVLS